jgi:hypothetical protein
MDAILNYIGAYKKLYDEYPKLIIAPSSELAGKIIYVIDEMLIIPEQPNTITEIFTSRKPSAIASVKPPFEIHIVNSFSDVKLS